MRNRLSVNSRRDQAGFTLLELLISAVILVAMMLVVFQFTSSGQEMARVDTIKAALQGRAMRIVETVVDQIRKSGANQIVPASPLGTETSLDFLQVIGLDDTTGALYSANPLNYSLVNANGETYGDGVDNNGDGLIDEQLLRYTSADGEAVIVGSGVKGYDISAAASVVGFRVRRAPGTDRLRLALTLQQADRHGKLYEVTYVSSVTLRNQ